jgi:hypothetical protein
MGGFFFLVAWILSFLLIYLLKVKNIVLDNVLP